MSRLTALSAGASSLALTFSLLTPQHAIAHGYLNDPPSRAFACQKGLNKDCGGAQYEPQSVGETAKGFPATGVPDGKIASGALSQFAALDVQSATRWHKTEIKDRTVAFDWYYKATHPATKYEYFITQNGWNPNAELTRNSFDLTPFCVIDAGGRLPTDSPQGSEGPAREKHSCQIPADRSGHHVILGLWTVHDTPGAFHNVVDVDIVAEAETPDGWRPVGNITPRDTLWVGDKVKARALMGEGESAEFSSQVSIADEDEGKPENWSFKLASQINDAHTLVRAGVRGDDGVIAPIKGTNTLYAKQESGVNRYELHMDLIEDAQAELAIQPVGQDLELVKGRATLPLVVTGNRTMNVEATVFDSSHKSVGAAAQVLTPGSTTINIDLRSAPGDHQIKLIGVTPDGRTSRQALGGLTLSGEGGGQDYDAIYPQGMETYTAGTTVLQPADGNVYECKPFPASGWCAQSPHHFEPGSGSDWQDAWILQ
ncbi:lytic polysaccharide monooxygenase [Pseudomonas sp. RC10]|uniref:lytic polysaccharide monooxygenase n=1 Tax=Pseudomonas bambusae TaxID=3139142 RepID=UPI00313A2FEC